MEYNSILKNIDKFVICIKFEERMDINIFSLFFLIVIKNNKNNINEQIEIDISMILSKLIFKIFFIFNNLFFNK
jgi:hypothetical protein